MVGSRVPAGASGGRVRNPSTIVPSTLLALKRSTVPRRMPLRNPSFTVLSRRSPLDGPSVKTSGGSWGSLTRSATSPFAETLNSVMSRSPATTRSTVPPAEETRARWRLPPSSIRK
jgi:hypothetical protein